MSPEDKQYFRKLIEQRLAELETSQEQAGDETKAIEPDVSIGRLSRLDSMQMQQMALEAKRRRDGEAQKLRQALKRVDAGTYGVCLFCRQPIQRERLEVQLDAVACIRCA